MANDLINKTFDAVNDRAWYELVKLAWPNVLKQHKELLSDAGIVAKAWPVAGSHYEKEQLGAGEFGP